MATYNDDVTPQRYMHTFGEVRLIIVIVTHGLLEWPLDREDYLQLQQQEGTVVDARVSV